MGYDVTLIWEGQTEEEEEDAVTLSHSMGNCAPLTTFLPEIYHREIYDTDDYTEISSALLRERLPETMKVFRETYNVDPAADIRKELMWPQYERFLEAVEQKERETGKPCRIAASY